MNEWSPNKEDICKHRFLLLQKLRFGQRLCICTGCQSRLLRGFPCVSNLPGAPPEAAFLWVWAQDFPTGWAVLLFYTLPQPLHPVQSSAPLLCRASVSPPRRHVLLTFLSSVMTQAPRNLVVSAHITTYSICSACGMFANWS